MEHDECAQAGWEQRGPRVVAIGGGTGLSTMLRGLKLHTQNLTAIVTVADDGGSSGRLRSELDVIPPGDLRMALAALAAHMLTIWMSLIAATVLGCGYGMAMIAGLLEVQRIAARSGRNDLAGLTAVFYSVTYLGFAIPAVLALITEFWHAVTYTHMFIFGIVAALLCLAVALYGHRRHAVAA